MPELPEVETVRRGLIPVLTGRRISRVAQHRPDLRFPLPDGFAGRLAGRAVRSIERRGKYLLFVLDDGNVWIAHLGMSGRFVIDPDESGDMATAGGGAYDAHDHVVLFTEGGAIIRYRDPRRFGFMDLTPAAVIDRHPMLSGLGCDPLGETFTPAWLKGRLAGRSAPIKTALLDQTVVAGMGNIYASESLFRAGVSPERPAAAAGVGRGAARLAAAIRTVFTAAIAAGGSSLRDHRQPSGELGFFQHQFAVYGRAGMACPGCRCDLTKTGGIRRIVQSGRATYYCGRRQR